MKLRLLVFASLITFSLFAQTLTPKQEQIVRGVIAKQFNDEMANNTALYLGENSFVLIENDTFLSLQGYHYLFRLKNDSAERLDHSFFHGGNFERYLYVYDGKIYLMGGYGLFNTNNNIEVFDFKSKEWGVIKTTGDKPPFIRGVCIRKGDFIYSLYNSKKGNMVEEDSYDNHIYRLDLKTNIWQRFNNLNKPEPQIFDKVYTKDYCVAVLSNTALIVNKKTIEFIYIPREQLRISIKDLFNFSVNGNNLYFRNYLSTPSNTVDFKVNLDSVWSKNATKAEQLILEPFWYQIPWLQYLIIAIVLLLIVGFLMSQKLRNRKKISDNLNVDLFSNPLLEKLQASTKNTLDIDELDALLEINHMEFDSRKLKRHRLLSDLEKTNPGLITRQKDETDRRRFIYIIKKTEQK